MGAVSRIPRARPRLISVRRLERFAWFVLVVNIVTIALGAVVRSTGSGAGCGRSWPTCQGEIVPELAGATAVEFTHRAVSGVALLLVFTLAFMVWRRVPVGHQATARCGPLSGCDRRSKR